MPNYKKYKIRIMIPSVIIIIFIVSFNNAFYQKTNLTNWKELTSDNFKGIVKPFSKFDATISQDIIIEYDSLKQKYTSKAVQKDNLSWMRNDSRDNANLLKHEQYHFNITEYHSRLLNTFLDSINPKKDFELKFKVDSIFAENHKMQNSYDNETNHSLIKKKQTMWENKIDSLLESVNNRKINHHLLTNKNFTKEWIQLESFDTIIEKVEVFISKKKDSIYNQYFKYNKNKIDTLNSEFYILTVNNTNQENIYDGELTFYNKHYNLKLDSQNKRETEFYFFEQNKDSIWISDVKSKSKNKLKFKFKNYYNNKLYGILYQRTMRDTIIKNDTMINLSRTNLLITNKKNNSDFYIKSYEFDKERIFSLKNIK